MRPARLSDMCMNDVPNERGERCEKPHLRVAAFLDAGNRRWNFCSTECLNVKVKDLRSRDRRCLVAQPRDPYFQPEDL